MGILSIQIQDDQADHTGPLSLDSTTKSSAYKYTVQISIGDMMMIFTRIQRVKPKVGKGLIKQGRNA